ncbi:MAG: hypothetical protein VW802_06150 [Rhodospirillaceae bacterium]|jgi:hypothetical protein
MTMVNRQHIIIPYGLTHWDKNVFSSTMGAGGDLVINCRTRFVVIDPTEHSPLRLNGGQYEFHEPPNMRLLPTVLDQLAFLETHFFALCGTWSKMQRLFISRYFEFIVNRVEAERSHLSKSIEAFGNLYEYQDWAYSALRPLPQAYVFAPRGGSGEGLPQADDFILTDIVFWTGKKVFVLDFSDPNATDPFQKRKFDRIKNAGIKILPMTADILEDKSSSNFANSLPEVFQNFWQGELAPSRPFVDTKLGDLSISDIGF